MPPARKAVQVLLDEGLLYRLAERGVWRFGSDPADRKMDPQIVLLAPAVGIKRDVPLQIGLTQVCARFNCSLRTVHYAHWDDPLLLNSLERFDGAFFMPVPESCPPIFCQSFWRSKANRCPGRDCRSNTACRPMSCTRRCSVQKLLDHLAGLGHRKIDCFNVQPMDSTLETRIQQWNVGAQRGRSTAN